MARRRETGHRSQNSNTRRGSEYIIRYGTDANAALQPEYIPVPRRPRPEQPERVKPHVVPQSVPKPGAQSAPQPRKNKGTVLRAFTTLSIVTVAVLACAVVMRNSQIYENSRDIKATGELINTATYELNTARLTLSAGDDVNKYLEIAENELNMSYANNEESIVFTINSEEASQTELTGAGQNRNIIDSVLDWFNSLERRG